jgi:O-antigen chain-terminating methyltransferase
MSNETDRSTPPDAVNVERIMEGVRAQASKRDIAVLLDDEAARNLAALRASADVYNTSLRTAWRGLGPVLRFAKRIGRWALQPSLARQVWYNTANAVVAERLREQCEVLVRRQGQILERFEAQRAAHADALREVREHLSSLETRIGELNGRGEVAAVAARQEQLGGEVAAVASRQERLRTEVQSLHDELWASQDDLAGAAGARRALRERIARVERRLRRLAHTLGNGHAEAIPVVQPPVDIGEVEFDNLGFAERFRGSEEEIKERQRSYLKYFVGCDNVVDIGCGRGEFLELLRDAGVEARGIDTDLDMFLCCQEKGLDVQREDLTTFLEGLPDSSVGGIFCAQVVEHLDAGRIVRLVRTCGRKLRPGAYLVVETVNPGCLLTFAESFYLDLFHVRPIHSRAMSFVLEMVGFRDLEILFSAPVDPSWRIPPHPHHAPESDQFNAAVERLNNVLYGFQDYAVVGRATPRAEACEE